MPYGSGSQPFFLKDPLSCVQDKPGPPQPQPAYTKISDYLQTFIFKNNKQLYVFAHILIVL